MDELSLDLAQDGSLVTGERLKTKLARTCISRIQDARILLHAAPLSRMNQKQLEEFSGWIGRKCIHEFCASGECRHSTIAYLRYLAEKGDFESMRKADRFIDILAEHRDGKGGWKGFPLYYTLLALTETKSPRAAKEIVYAVSACRTNATKTHVANRHTAMREEILHRALSLVQHSVEGNEQAYDHAVAGLWRLSVI